jgi:hypothetical protein
MAIEINGVRYCGAVTKYAGKCEDCGYSPPVQLVRANRITHEGVCEKCGGRMVCMRRLNNPQSEHCGHHISQSKAAKVTVDAEGLKSIHVRDQGLMGVLPEELRRLYVEAFTDPRLLSLRPEVALFAAREIIMADRLNTGESGELWAMLLTAKFSFVSANEKMSELRREISTATSEGRMDDVPGLQELFEQQKATMESSLKAILRMIDKGNDLEDAWRELLTHCERTAEMKRMQHARLKDLKQNITAEQALSMFGAVVAAVRKCFPNREDRRALESELTAILRLPSPDELPVRNTSSGVVESQMQIAASLGGIGPAIEQVIGKAAGLRPAGGGGTGASGAADKSSGKSSGKAGERKRPKRG